MEVVSDRRYRFARPPEEVWAALANTDDYPRWWPWLRRFDAAGLDAGTTWRCTVRPPLPYAVSFDLHLDDVTPPTAITATLAGDIIGRARIDLAPAPGGSELRLTATLAPSGGARRLLSRVFAPVVRYGHDWVLDTGARQFGAHVAAVGDGA